MMDKELAAFLEKNKPTRREEKQMLTCDTCEEIYRAPPTSPFGDNALWTLIGTANCAPEKLHSLTIRAV
jgi:hypothetical protein